MKTDQEKRLKEMQRRQVDSDASESDDSAGDAGKDNESAKDDEEEKKSAKSGSKMIAQREALVALLEPKETAAKAM